MRAGTERSGAAPVPDEAFREGQICGEASRDDLKHQVQWHRHRPAIGPPPYQIAGGQIGFGLP